MRTILITGTSSGLGEYLASKLVEAGNKVIGISRSPLNLNSKLSNYLDFYYSHYVCDIKDRVSLLRLIKELPEEAINTLSAVISNAGIYGPLGSLKNIESEEFIDSINVNLIGPFLLSQSLIPIICANKIHRPKFIQISGGGATKPMNFALGYAASKAAVVRLMESIALEYNDICDINSIAPGLLNTKLLDQVIDAGEEKVGKVFFENMKSEKSKGGTDMIKTFNLINFLLSDKSNGITGKLISAVWDEYESWPSRIDSIKGKDIFTLTRKT